jgi:hypothetical protein
MFESWLLLKIDYTSSASSETQTGIVGYEHLTDAEHVFSQLQLSYQFDLPVRIKNDQMIKVTGVCLYRVFKFTKKDEIDALKSGDGTLMYKAQGIQVEIE